ncbi:cytochrome c oxidase assembly protein subunit 15 [Arthrobacter subterraneus]|uniref:Cytochrome c oxidase assembly protein subunit 15 n=1 Tax=Arthrobacter subterraneus TaxID=335973 RepID=A0A1G8EJ39_9MICC|nr:COX15/CtaA family protein [Arthrobacter subterraneus]SDH69812.1 cytochrome c oxidase assembly protein subunit 15 [Arthrobacter subterraneus]
MTQLSPARFAARLPRTVTPLVRGLALASLVSQILIVVTGGAVRLTASGLGCPEWPRCTAESMVATPEMGMHGVIEFGNRLLTFVLTAIAIAMLVSLWNMRRTRRDLFIPAVVLLAGIPAQAVVGGITVLTQLNPWVVGWHFIISMILIVVATVLVNRARLTDAETGVDTEPRAAPLLRQLLVAAAGLVAAAVLLGVVVTGSGPHAGDSGAARNNLNPDLMTRIHAAPVYLLVLTVVLLVVAAYRLRVAPRLRGALVLLAVVVLAQGAVGYLQHFLHLPVALVALHMLGASLLTAATAHAVYVGFTRRRADQA